MTKKENFFGQATPNIIDTEYERCNFGQPQPVGSGDGVYIGVRIFPDNDTPRTFIQCQLQNAEVPPGSTVIDCNTSIVQKRIASGDGFVNRIHGRWTADGYEYRDSPTDVETD